MECPSKRGCPWRLAPALIALAAVMPAGAQNLLANPGFEDLSADVPARWDHFVQPKPGAVAAVSDAAHGGTYAVWLHTPTPYEKEPVNNWSQNILGGVGGDTVRVSGFIRVEDAKEAAIWLQMWRKRPWGVLGAETTSKDMPVYGTRDWQQVSMDVAVPEGTDFVTVRCVLLGTGSAWFDDLSVTRVSKDSAAPAVAPAPTAKTGTAPAVAPTPPGETASPADVPVDPGEFTGTPAGTPPASATGDDAGAPTGEPGTVMPMMNVLESEVKRLRDANVILTDTLQQIQQVNQELLREMLSVQSELRDMKTEKDAAKAPALDPARRRVPPLVPLSAAEELGAP